MISLDDERGVNISSLSLSLFSKITDNFSTINDNFSGINDNFSTINDNFQGKSTRATTTQLQREEFF